MLTGALLLGTAVSVLGGPAEAAPRSDAVWQAFRAGHPFHAQVVGLSGPAASGERVLILSEPPPLLQRARFREALTSVFGGALKSAELKRNPVGFDGWVEDIVATLAYPDTQDGNARLAADLTRLAQHMFGTAYKFAAIKLADPGPGRTVASPPSTGLAPPNLDVTAAELNEWLLAPGRTVVSLESDLAVAMKDLLRDGQPGIYLSPERGLVVLLLARDAKLNAMRADLRKFAVDTDAIVGAVAAETNRLAIVGRERDTSVETVPPLRVETILALANTGESELGQSYERNAVFAGKLSRGPDRERDWAPIYLSKDLVNTEFGSLLNVTDQLLKSWTMSRQVQYVNFPYPTPSSFPFEKPLYYQFGKHSLTFNWNTTGVGSVSTISRIRVFSLNRTGSLPISYCPGEDCSGDQSAEVTQAEERAYDWFSHLRDPYLERAVQYAALYQIFRAFPIAADRDEAPPANYHAATSVLLARTERAVGRLADVPVEQFASLGPDVRELQDAAEQLGDIKAHCGDAGLRLIALNLADRQDPAAVDPVSCSPGMSTELGDALAAAKAAFKRASGDDAVRADYVNAARPIETGYIKTPSIVLSWDEADRALTGGHNLYSKVTNVETSGSVARGSVRIEQRGGTPTLILNPEDEAHSNALARAYARNTGKSELEVRAILKAELAQARALRPLREGLAVADIAPQEGRGLTASRAGNVTADRAGLFPDAGTSVDRYGKIAADRHLDLVLARDGDSYLVVRFVPPPPTPLRAATEPALLEALSSLSARTARGRLPSGLPPVKIGFGEGFSEGELHGMIESETFRTAAGGGGWDPPRPPRSLTGFAPEPERPNGFFFQEEGGGTGGRDGYSTFDARGDDIRLQFALKERARIHDVLAGRVDWAKATVRRIDPIPVGPELRSFEQIGFEITVPVKDLSFAERLHLAGRNSLITRVVAFFKRATTPADAAAAQSAVDRVMASAVSGKAVPVDTIAALKQEILESVKPDALRFYNQYGADDLMIVRNDAAPATDGPG